MTEFHDKRLRLVDDFVIIRDKALQGNAATRLNHLYTAIQSGKVDYGVIPPRDFEPAHAETEVIQAFQSSQTPPADTDKIFMHLSSRYTPWQAALAAVSMSAELGRNPIFRESPPSRRTVQIDAHALAATVLPYFVSHKVPGVKRQLKHVIKRPIDADTWVDWSRVNW